MRLRYKFGLEIIIIALLLLILPNSALADAIVTQIGGNPVSVPAGHSVESIYSVGADAWVAGRVTDAVLVINGNVYLEPTAEVDLVIDLGGHIHNTALKTPKTGIFEVYFSEKLINNSLVGVAMLCGVWVLRVVFSLLAIMFLTCFGYLMRSRLGPAENLLSLSIPRLFGIGSAVSLLIFSLIILFTLTVYGIPIAVILAVFCVIAVVVGLIPVIQYIGNKVLSPRLLEYPAIFRWLAQCILFFALVSLPILGSIFLFVMGLTGLGLTVTIVWTHFRLRKSSLT